MKRLMMISFTTLLTAGMAQAISVDSIKSFTGASRVKFIWERTAYCGPDYSPMAQPSKSLMLFDTDEGVERALDNNAPSYYNMRITRSGKWALWSNEDIGITFILDITSATAGKRVLLDKANVSYYAMRAVWMDPGTKRDYVFCVSDFDTKQAQFQNIWKVPLNQDGTADSGNAVKLKITWNAGQAHYMDGSMGVSADGTKLGGAFPWPETYILDIPTGRLDYRHHDGFGCQATIAPDNSYRFSHCNGDHFGIYMFAANMVDQNWEIDLSSHLVYMGTKTGMDFEGVHWSNHVQFLVSSPPMNDNWDYYDQGHYAGRDAAWVKANTDIVNCKKTVLHKFTADFKDVESSIAIADIRYGEARGDIWLSNGVTGGDPTISSSPSAKAKVVSPIQVAYAGDLIALRADQRAFSQVMVVDPRGKLVRRWSAQGNASFSVKDLNPGTYCIIATSGEFGVTKRISVKR